MATWVIYVHDRDYGITELISVASDGTQANHASYWASGISDDGRYVAFESYATNLGYPSSDVGIYLRDRLNNETVPLSYGLDGEPANNHTVNPFISASGKFVTYDSSATNLVVNDYNGSRDVFFDRN